MTKPRQLGNVMKQYRDGAADNANEVTQRMDRLIAKIGRGEFTRQGIRGELTEMSRLMHITMRHLEKMGAETEPQQ